MATNVGGEQVGLDGAERTRLQAEIARLKALFPKYPQRYLYILLAVGAVDSADRTILSTVFEDVKKAFDVSDTQLGLLTAAYSVVATLSVIPFGWLADHWNRVRLIALGFLPWAAAMFLTGASQSFTMMFMARLFLGTIEATNGPSTPSLLGDYYPVSARSRLFGIVGIGGLVGSVLGFAVGGLIASLAGWRMAFYLWGAFGLVCAGVVLKALREPARGIPDALHHNEHRLARLEHTQAASQEDPDPSFGLAGVPGGNGASATVAAAAAFAPEELVSSRPPGTCDYRTLGVKEAAREVLRVKTMWIVFAASSAGEFLMSGLGTWAVSYFRRYHDLSAASAGIVVGLLAISCVGGIILGARRGDRYMVQGRPSMRIRLAAISRILSVFTLVIAFSTDNLPLSVPFFLMSGFLIGVPWAPLDAVGLDILISHLRGRASSLRSLIRVGAAGGSPLLFGFLSDQYTLRGAILMSTPMLLVAGGITLLAIKTYPSDLAFTLSESARQASLEFDEETDGAEPAEVTNVDR